MRTIKVYGELAKKLGRRTFVADVETVAEAIKFLLANFPHIEQHISEQHYRIKTGKNIISSEEIGYPSGSGEVISIIPVVVGAGNIGKIIAGAFLIAVSFLIPGAQLLGVALAPIAFGIGASLVLGGIAGLLTPNPLTSKKEKDPKESYSFSGIQNSSRSGLPIPVIYGETVVGSITISAGIFTEKVQ